MHKLFQAYLNFFLIIEVWILTFKLIKIKLNLKTVFYLQESYAARSYHIGQLLSRAFFLEGTALPAEQGNPEACLDFETIESKVHKYLFLQ